jgi:hypothetical protein
MHLHDDLAERVPLGSACLRRSRCLAFQANGRCPAVDYAVVSAREVVTRKIYARQLRKQLPTDTAPLSPDHVWSSLGCLCREKEPSAQPGQVTRGSFGRRLGCPTAAVAEGGQGQEGRQAADEEVRSVRELPSHGEGEAAGRVCCGAASHVSLQSVSLQAANKDLPP